MTFADKLNELISIIEASTGEIAKFSGFDRSNVSRLRSGKRIPAADGSTTQKLVRGIYLAADSRNTLSLICSRIGIRPDAPADAVRERMREWLFEDTVNAVPAGSTASDAPAQHSMRQRKAKPDPLSFAKRLDASMTLAGFSNIRLSRLLHIDASLISRYRSGVRTPHSNPELSEHLCMLLLERIIRNERLPELAELMRQPVNEIDKDTFHDWLLFMDRDREHESQIAEDLLESFDSFTPNYRLPLPTVEEAAPDKILNARDNIYYGTEGLRTAVRRFLGNAVRGKVPELLLYSDEAQGWMTDDPVFRLQWASLMSACVRNGTRIRIIHNIDRNLEEMTQAFISWLPLYMSGMIDSFYSRRQRDPRFSHTIFLCPGAFCISAFHSVGSEQEGIYHYYTDKRSLEICRADYDMLLHNTGPLFTTENPAAFKETAEITAIRNGLSLATMPETLVRRIGDPALTAGWETAHAALLRHLETGVFNECVPLCDDQSLFDGTCRIESIDGREQYYTPEQYSEHLQNILRLSQEYPGYHFYPLPETPFPNIRLLISRETTRIIHVLNPSISFAFTHPAMCSAFCGYAGSLMDLHRMDRASLKKLLESRYM